MKPVTSIITKYSIILAIALLVERYILFLSPLNIPRLIPFTPINTDGLVLAIIFITVLIIFQKKLIKVYPDITIGSLTLDGAIICFVSEFLFQSIRRLTFIEGPVYDFLLGAINIPLFFTVISFFIAFQLKTKKTKWLVLFIVIFLLLFKLLIHFSIL